MIAFSDVHIGSRYSKIRELRECLKTLNHDNVIVAGDLFDDQHRKVSRDEALRLIRKAMEILGIRPRRLYISFSSHSHDPILPGPIAENVDGVEIVAHNGELIIENRFAVVHGDVVIRNGVMAYAVDIIEGGRVGRMIKKKLHLSRDLWLVYGHSHVPYIGLNDRIVNPGAWKLYGFRRIRGTVVELPAAKPLC